ncbi:hypothetical protein EJB05_55158, partial [Eragrostis curvula]
MLVDDAPAAPPAASAVVLSLYGATIDAMYPKFVHVGSAGHGDDGPCAICLGEFAGSDALRRGPGCGHCFHTCCAERWLRVSRDSPAGAVACRHASGGGSAPRAAHSRWHAHVMAVEQQLGAQRTDVELVCTSRAESSSID